MRTGILALVGLTSVGLAVALLALDASAQAPNAAALVKERQDLMKSFGGYMRGFTAVARGESTDVVAIPAQASEAVAAFRKIPGLFPAGTGREANADTRAKPEIWSQRADFESNVAKLVAATEKLGEAAKSGNIDAVKTASAGVGQACFVCHGGPPRSSGPFRFEAPQ